MLILTDNTTSSCARSFRLCDRATLGTLPDRFVVLPVLNDWLELSAEVGAVEGILADDRGLLVRAGLAVPA